VPARVRLGRRCAGKISGALQARHRHVHGPAQIVLGVGMRAWKTGALLPEDLRHPSRAEIPLQQPARDAIIGDTPIRLRKAFQQA